MTDPYNNPYRIEREDGTEIAEAETPQAIKDAARHLIESGEESGPLTLLSRLTGMTAEAFVDPRDPYGHVTISGEQGVTFR